jgi:hypothetical protein
LHVELVPVSRPPKGVKLTFNISESVCHLSQNNGDSFCVVEHLHSLCTCCQFFLDLVVA